MTVAEIETHETEDGRVVRWRLETLVRAGYPETDALLLAELTLVDLHLATDLLRRGCSPDTALRILL